MPTKLPIQPHTPGPWQVVAETVPLRIETVSYSPYEEPDQLAVITGPACTGPVDDREYERLANARLMAAAPRLYVMLQRLLGEICLSEEGMRLVAPATLEQAHAALAAAETRTYMEA